MTSTAVAVVPIADLQRYAETFSKSGMFGTKNVDQALSLLLLAQAEGLHPAIAMRDFDVIQGRPAKKAEAMHRSFLEAGGKIEWHALSDERADATFSHPQGGSVRISWDMARAQKAGLKGKDMYSKYPRQMLKARVISEGCRTVYPAATSGLYVPDEVVNFEKKPAEKNMGAADVVAPDEDITAHMPGAELAPAHDLPTDAESPGTPPQATGTGGSFITEEQVLDLGARFSKLDPEAERDFLRIAKIERLDRMTRFDSLGVDNYTEALDWIARRPAAYAKMQSQKKSRAA